MKCQKLTFWSFMYLVANTVFLLKRGQKSTKLHGYCHAAALIAKKVVIIIKKRQAAANVDRKTEAQCEKARNSLSPKNFREINSPATS